MLILNFSHPLTDAHKARIEVLAASAIDAIHTIPVHIDQSALLESQVRTIVDAIHLTSQEWQTLPLLINPPGYAPAACTLLAELHGRMGHFPTLIQLRPKADATTSYEVAKLLNLQTIRETARTRR